MLLQMVIYAGVPAANTGFRIAAEEIEKHGNTNAAPACESSNQ
jgi:alkylhydroperoxidase/carboxymuconolactone decarboxylase family protein YurZ